jgi:hypothetical protein
VAPDKLIPISPETLRQWKLEYPKADFERIITAAANSSLNDPFPDLETVRETIIYRAQRASGIAA